MTKTNQDEMEHTEDNAKEVPKMTRDDYRKSIFDPSKTKLKRVPIPFNGVDLEFRQPSIATAAKMQSDNEEQDNFIVRMLIAFSYIPGTDERVFDDADYDSIVAMPADGSFQGAVKVISDLLNLNVEEKVKN